MASKKRYVEFRKWPEFKKLYIYAFEKMLKVREERGIQTGWRTGEDVFHWWMEDDVLPGQIGFDDLETEEDDG